MSKQNEIHKTICNDQQLIKGFNRLFTLYEKREKYWQDCVRLSISFLTVIKFQDILSKYEPDSKIYKRGIRRQAHYKNGSYWNPRTKHWEKYKRKYRRKV